jgi:hypothetical protein
MVILSCVRNSLPNSLLGGRHADATHILAQISGKNLPTDDPAVVSLKKDIDDAIALELADGPWKFTECFKSGPLKVRRRFLLAIGNVHTKSIFDMH